MNPLYPMVSLFNPRRDDWNEHFEWNHDGTLIIGKTAIGRATIKALQLNSSEQQFSRSLWKRLDLFP